MFLLYLSIFCAAQNKKYPEIINSGYKGKIRSITIKIYSDSIKDKSADSLISVKTRYYNEDGNATKESYQSDKNQQVTEYEFKNGLRTGYSLSRHGEVRLRAKIIQQKGGYIINLYDLQNRQVSKDKYKYNELLRIKSNERMIYDNRNGQLKSHSFVGYYYSEEGFISGYDVKDLLTAQTVTYRFQISHKDDHKNPDKLILLKNNRPFQSHSIDIEYYK
ncbi:hypothetical protein [Chryseobacterium lathyri]|uniref:hypothetical protein n=1 Tax=Chryseobacterium lathyri TaxID=395933 RepID=UPI002783C4D5|nr:hypothetical protein [Chryseobacterium lathyri]MDQ0066370.1 hypothetical protein [Chryseobacterium lathyri]